MRRLKMLLAILLAILLAGCGAGAPPEAGGGETAAPEVTLRFFNVGKADAVLITWEGRAVLVDAGTDDAGPMLAEYFRGNGIGALDMLVITHFDKDHVGGAAKVLNGIPVGRVLQSNQPKDSDEYENYVEALRGAGIEPVTLRETDTFSLDGVSYTVDPPRQSAYAQDSSNNSSLIVSVRYGDTGILLPGDAQTLRLAEFLDANTTTYDVLKLPHHGRDEPLLEALLASVKPTYAIITSSEEEPESGAVLAALEQAGVRTLLTRNQSVTLYSDGITIKQKE